MTEEFENKLKTRGLDWSISFLEKCGGEGSRLSTQFKLLLQTKSLIQTSTTEEEDIKSINLADYLTNLIQSLQESNHLSNQSHQTILDELKRSAKVFRDHLSYFPEQLEGIFVELDFPLWVTYLALQLFYKFEVQALKITGLVEFLDQGPLPEIQTCLRFQLAHSHLLLDEIEWASHYIDQLKAEVTFKDHLVLNTELEFLSIRRDFHLAQFEIASTNLHKLLYIFNDQTNLDIYLDLYIISTILSKPSKDRYQKLLQLTQLIKLESSLPFHEILELMANEKPVLDLPAYPHCLTRRLIEKGVLFKSLRLHNLWVRSKSVESPLALIDLPMTMGFKTSDTLARELLQELIDDKVLQVKFENNLIMFLNGVEVGNNSLISTGSNLGSSEGGSHLILSTQPEENTSNEMSLVHKPIQPVKKISPIQPLRKISPFPLKKSKQPMKFINLNTRSTIELTPFPDNDEALDNLPSPAQSSSYPIDCLDETPQKSHKNESEQTKTINLISESDNGSGPALSNRSSGSQKRQRSNPEASTSKITQLNASHSSTSSNSSHLDHTYTATPLPSFMKFKKISKKQIVSAPEPPRNHTEPEKNQSLSSSSDYLLPIEVTQNFQNCTLLSGSELDKIVSVDYLKRNRKLVDDSLRHHTQEKGYKIDPTQFISRLKADPNHTTLSNNTQNVMIGVFKSYLEYYSLGNLMSLPLNPLKIINWFLNEKSHLALISLQSYFNVFFLLGPLIDHVLESDGKLLVVGAWKEGGFKDHLLWRDLVAIKKKSS